VVLATASIPILQAPHKPWFQLIEARQAALDALILCSESRVEFKL
jgi:hypothetical protein